KCAPHSIKTVLENAGTETDPKIRTYSGGAGGCPAGTHYMGIRPNGDVTPCPYLPVFAGNLRRAALTDLWTSSELFTDIRRRSSHEEDPGVRPGDGRQGCRGFLPKGRHQPRYGGGAGADSRADADPEILRVIVRTQSLRTVPGGITT